MESFKPIELEDRDIFLKYLGDYEFNTYEYSFLNLYLWRRLCNTEYSIIDGALIIKKTEKDKGTYFMQPVGYTKGSLERLVIKLVSFKEKCPDMKYLFGDIEEPFLEELREIFGDRVKVNEDTNNFDYIYEREKLASLSGRKLHGKKNHYNQFISTYTPEIKNMKEIRVMEHCMDFMQDWLGSKESNSDHLEFEINGTRDVMANFDYLNAEGMAVYVEDKIAGFTIGERVNKNMAIIHIEKGDPDYKGIYAYINKTFAKNHLSDVTFINREEDLGIEGLRKAKSSYHPFKLEKKYIIEIQ